MGNTQLWKKTAELIGLRFGLWVPGVSTMNRVLDGVHIGATWQIRLKDCARAVMRWVGLPPGVATWPVHKIVWTIRSTTATRSTYHGQRIAGGRTDGQSPRKACILQKDIRSALHHSVTHAHHVIHKAGRWTIHGRQQLIVDNAWRWWTWGGEIFPSPECATKFQRKQRYFDNTSISLNTVKHTSI